MKHKLPLFSILFTTAFSLFSFPPLARAQNHRNIYQLWQIRSIDTMKTSRDRARSWSNAPGLDLKIETEMKIIKSLGANYVAIGTPYDAEFLPNLRAWVAGARAYGLHVWFRGNWSSWEGWFEFPKNMTPDEHLQKTAQFIENHPDLFEDGDIFDPCPECENNGYWRQPEDNVEYNKFLQKQYQITQKSFQVIQKNVHANIVSVIGGRAKDVMDVNTIVTLNNVVTIDHYVRDPKSMGEYLNYFSKNFKAKIILGEFGAPILDINGRMNEGQQADFVDNIFKELNKYKENVTGVNYWTLFGGSTSLLNMDFTPRRVVEVVRNYYMPGIIKGKITNTLGEAIKGIFVKTDDGLNHTVTNKQGLYEMVIPAGNVKIIFDGGKNNKIKTTNVVINHNADTIENVVLESKNIGIIYKIKLFFMKLFSNFKST